MRSLKLLFISSIVLLVASCASGETEPPEVSVIRAELAKSGGCFSDDDCPGTKVCDTNACASCCGPGAEVCIAACCGVCVAPPKAPKGGGGKPECKTDLDCPQIACFACPCDYYRCVGRKCRQYQGDPNTCLSAQ